MRKTRCMQEKNPQLPTVITTFYYKLELRLYSLPFTWVLSLLSYIDYLFCFWVNIFTLWYTVSSFYYRFTHTLLKGPTLILISLKTLYNTWLGDWNCWGILESGSISFSALNRKINTIHYWSDLKDLLKWLAVIGSKSSKNIKKKKKKHPNEQC